MNARAQIGEQEAAHLPAMRRSLSEVVAEYEEKRANIPAALNAFNAAGTKITDAATIGGTYGNTTIDTGKVYERTLEESLLKSAWLHVYNGLNIKYFASPKDKDRFKMDMEKPAPFTLENIRATFGDYILDPRGSILRALAEVFCSLDPAYKSHDKVKIGVKGLPKRVILSNVSDYSWGRARLEAIINALAAYQGKPLIEWREISALLEQEDALLAGGTLPANRTWSEPMTIVGRGIRLRRFDNGNGHLFFEKQELADINRALAEFYGEVLADTPDEAPTKRASTAVSKDLQYYPTPTAVVDQIIADLYQIEGAKVLEPSCGCGRFMDGLRTKGAKVVGIEVDPSRAGIARAKGHAVRIANFLEVEPTGDFDLVVMNPPFYGKHYAKHVAHALKFLKPGGRLIAILPSTARYDHGLIDARDNDWHDLPVGSFSESGTNINTSVVKIRKPEA